MPLYLQDMAGVLSLSPERLGILGGAEFAAIGIASALSLLWIGRISWRTIAMVGSLAVCIGDLLTIRCTTYDLILICRIVTGLFGEGVLYSLSFAVLAQTRDPDRSIGVAILAMTGLLAVVMFKSPWLVFTFGNSVLVVILAVLAASVIPLKNWIPERSIQLSAGDRPAGSRPSADLLVAMWGLMAQALWFVGPGGYWAFAGKIGSWNFLSLETTDTALSFGVVAGAAGCLLPARIGGRYGRIWPIVLSTVCFVGIALASQRRLNGLEFASCMFGFSIMWNLGSVYLFGIVAAADPDGRLAVLIPASQSVGLGVGPALMGYVIGRFGSDALGWTFALVALGSLAVVLPFARRVVGLHRSAIGVATAEPTDPLA